MKHFGGSKSWAQTSLFWSVSSSSSGFFRSEIFISKLRTPPLLSYVLRLLSCSPKRETLRFETTALNSHSHWCSCCCCCSLEKVAPSALNIFYLPFKKNEAIIQNWNYFSSRFSSQNMRKKLICQQPTWRENSITFRKMPEGIKKNSFLKPGGSQIEGTHTMGPSHVLLNMYNSKFASDLHIILF